MRQRDANPIPQACCKAFRPPATPRPASTLRIELYSAANILAQTQVYVNTFCFLARTIGFCQSFLALDSFC